MEGAMDQDQERQIDIADLADLRTARMGLLGHREIMGCDRVGRVVAWDAASRRPFLTGATLGGPEASGLSFIERDRIERDGYRYGLMRPDEPEAAPAPRM
jgi:hypothetical protein